ncbi:uncharacterized protein F4822DRAFT_251625 [Hypoxylon trugodes]|uniref:uncharacterized protein n=1 Tax=Hypoxylon trugodes TaxID=326681 RepID=UPI00219FBE4C|nr:uncharacterized protein F4822DRAFT_251625 [Hypoxylon trugodes]KAI1388617.1 hypothetical protein F4822DRAFT_251625 [Hypoxylon trugodes]
MAALNPMDEYPMAVSPLSEHSTLSPGHSSHRTTFEPSFRSEDGIAGPELGTGPVNLRATADQLGSDRAAYFPLATHDYHQDKTFAQEGSRSPFGAKLSRGSTVYSNTENEEKSPNVVVPDQHPQRPSLLRPSSPWWWWWEISSSIVSIIAMCLVIAILCVIYDKPASTWTWPITPNSLVAMCTTVGKSAMLVSVASCISQLKWRHFTLGPRPLDHIQAFDDASRGPWGSLSLLVRGRVRVIPVWSLALITLVALGIEPTTQQIIGWQLRETRVTNATAQIGRALVYKSNAYPYPPPSFYWPTAGLLPFQSSIINAMINGPSIPRFICPSPAVRCAWPDFTTLGVCGTFENVTTSEPPVCTYFNSTSNMTCMYSVPTDEAVDTGTTVINIHPPPLGMNMTFMFTGTYEAPGNQEMATHMEGDGWGSIGKLTILRVTDKYIPISRELLPTDDNDLNKYKDNRTTPLPVEMIRISWKWCVRRYHDVTYESGDIVPQGNLTTEKVISTGYTEITAEQPDEFEKLTTLDAKTQFLISPEITTNIQGFLKRLFSNIQLFDRSRWNFDGTGAGGSNTTIDITSFLYDADLKAVGYNIAEEITNQLRQSNPGDNPNATMIEGDAYMQETYMVVRWGWLALPLLETLIAAGLLVLSIYLSYGQPLLMTSNIALLLHPLKGWGDDELRVTPETINSIDRWAEKENAQLISDEKGNSRFVRFN